MREGVPDGPNAWALRLEGKIADLEVRRAKCRTMAARRPINRQLHALRDLLKWCKSRAGYVETPQDLGLLEPDEGTGR